VQVDETPHAPNENVSSQTSPGEKAGQLAEKNGCVELDKVEADQDKGAHTQDVASFSVQKARTHRITDGDSAGCKNTIPVCQPDRGLRVAICIQHTPTLRQLLQTSTSGPNRKRNSAHASTLHVVAYSGFELAAQQIFQSANSATGPITC
jgi:hypothetical protein